MFGLGFIEIFILGLIAFLVFGPEQFPSVVRNFMRAFNELRRAWTDVKSEVYDVEVEVEKQIRQITDDIDEDLQSIKKEMHFEDELEKAEPIEKPSFSTDSLSSGQAESKSAEKSEASKSREQKTSLELKKE